MRIIFDFRKYDGVIGGVEQGVIQVSKYLTETGHDIIIICKEGRKEEVKKVFEGHQNTEIKSLNVNTHSISVKNAMLDSMTIQNLAVKENVDVIHFFYNWSFPFLSKVPSLLTIHDVIPFTFREAMGLLRNKFLYKPGIKLACSLNSLIATVSGFSKQDIVKKVGVSSDKIRVIPNGLREPEPEDNNLEEELKERFEIRQSFILNVGGIHERKNIIRLIHAFSKLVNEYGYNGKLLITGSVSGHSYQEKMKEMCDKAIDETGMKEKIVFTGFIPENELDSLYRMAEFLIYPSLYEGFGIPVLEAMKLELPVITSSVTAMPEVAGDAACLVNPYDVSGMAEAMNRLLDNDGLRRKLKERGKERVKSFTWENTSESYLRVYRELI